LMLDLDQRCWYQVQRLKVRFIARQDGTPRSDVVESREHVSFVVLE
jgi:hypothetical protein